jgi:dTDP-4-dehydrorhamnose 3,5-epimerase
MKIIETNFNGLKIFKKQTFNDKRGYTRELFLSKSINKKFPFDILTFSKKNVLRGLHLQVKKPQGKFITVLKGKIYDVSVDCRKNSKTFGKYFSIILSEKENNSIFIPEGFAHGYCVLSDSCLMHYKMTNYRDKKLERGINWNDKFINIKWPIKKPIVSVRDKKNISFKEYIKLK